MCPCVHAHTCMHPRGPEEGIKLPGAGVPTAVSYLAWVLSTEVQCSPRAASSPNPGWPSLSNGTVVWTFPEVLIKWLLTQLAHQWQMKEMVPAKSISVNPLIVFGLLRGPKVSRYKNMGSLLVAATRTYHSQHPLTDYNPLWSSRAL